MQYLFSVVHDSAELATDSEMASIDAFNQRLVDDGHWVFAGGLGGATVVDDRRGEALVTDGPFVEAKEYVAGLWIIEAADADEAMALATEASRHCNRKVEVRPFLTLD